MGFIQGPTAIKTTAQAFTASWVNIGSEFKVQGFRKMALWLDIDINDTTGARVRVLVKRATAGASAEYSLPTAVVTASDDAITANIQELSSDADQQIVLKYDLDNLFVYVQVQIEAAVVGAGAGQVESIYFTLGN